MRDEVLLEARGLCKSYPHPGGVVDVLRDVDLTVRAGEVLAVVGRSGAGKSTLLHVLGGLEAPSAGTVTLLGQALWEGGETARARLRARHVGFVFQSHHLLPDFDALENVALAGLIAGLDPAEAESQARGWLERFGMTHRITHHPVELSGGECARVALARALVPSPAVLLADEPTGNLDRQQADRVLEDVLGIMAESGKCLIMVTHDPHLARIAGRVLELDEGRISG
ncbi:MAG: ABC transporter ATP-binding protein [Candidatus Delongbacteria bacterium]